MTASPTNWIIFNGAQVSVGDEVIAANGDRARITGVSRDGKGWPVLTYLAGPLKGFALKAHPQSIIEKVS